MMMGSLCNAGFVKLYKVGFTAELLWLEHLWNHENMFETGVV